MGSGASSLPPKLDKSALQAVCGSRFSEELYDKLKDSEGMVASEVVLKLAKRTDCFLSHDWGTDANGRNNHQRVAAVNELLKGHGLVTWFDAEQMEGDIVDRMCEGIDNTDCVVVFVTANYVGKVGGSNPADNCKREFSYAARRKGKSMLAVCMEESMRNANDWTGPVGMNLGGSLYVDLSSDETLEQQSAALAAAILKVVGPNRLALPEPKVAPKPPLKPASKETAKEPAKAPSKQQAELQAWLASLDIVEERVARYAAALTKKGIASVRRLQKKVEDDSEFLENIGIDEGDAGEISEALEKMQEEEDAQDEDADDEDQEADDQEADDQEAEEQEYDEEDEPFNECEVPCGICGKGIYRMYDGVFGGRFASVRLTITLPRRHRMELQLRDTRG